jgi:hypothetical protein
MFSVSLSSIPQNCPTNPSLRLRTRPSIMLSHLFCSVPQCCRPTLVSGSIEEALFIMFSVSLCSVPQCCPTYPIVSASIEDAAFILFSLSLLVQFSSYCGYGLHVVSHICRFLMFSYLSVLECSVIQMLWLPCPARFASAIRVDVEWLSFASLCSVHPILLCPYLSTTLSFSVF